MAYKINYEIAYNMMELKKDQVLAALNRNCILTSCAVLSFGNMRIYKEGTYLTLTGTRCAVSIYCKDNDGELVLMRKPKEEKLHFLYEDTLYFNESDFSFLYK